MAETEMPGQGRPVGGPSARGAVPAFYAMEFLREAGALKAAGKDVAFLCIGQPSVGAPARVVQAAAETLQQSVLGYTDALGVWPLRERIARHYLDTYGVKVAPERIAITTGSSAGFLLAFLAAFDDGARIAVARPGYPPYSSIQQALNLNAVPVDVGPETDYHMTPDHLRRLAEGPGGLQGVMVTSPANPTGAMLSPDELGEFITTAENLGVRVISDEIYHGVTFGKRAETALRFSDEAIVINSFSKYFCMTGWRLGWMVLPSSLLAAVEALAQSFYISPPTLAQQAAITVFDCQDELDGVVANYARNRALLLDALPRMGLDRFAPADGAFYLYVDVSRFTADSGVFCTRMLKEIHVAATPGVDFDPKNGHGFIRLSFAGDTAEIAKAISRMEPWLKQL